MTGSKWRGFDANVLKQRIAHASHTEMLDKIRSVCECIHSSFVCSFVHSVLLNRNQHEFGMSSCQLWAVINIYSTKFKLCFSRKYVYLPFDFCTPLEQQHRNNRMSSSSSSSASASSLNLVRIILFDLLVVILSKWLFYSLQESQLWYWNIRNGIAENSHMHKHTPKRTWSIGKKTPQMQISLIFSASLSSALDLILHLQQTQSLNITHCHNSLLVLRTTERKYVSEADANKTQPIQNKIQTLE